MMSNRVEYKGYFAKIEFSAEDGLLYGKIEGINDLVVFESETIGGVQQSFEEAVDDYLIMCQEIGQEPDKVYSGTFNVRIDPVLHRRLALLANKQDESLNKTVERVIQKFFADNERNRKIDEIWNVFYSASEWNGGFVSPKSFYQGERYSNIKLVGGAARG